MYVHVGKAAMHVHVGKAAMYVHVEKVVMYVRVEKAVIYEHVGKAAMYVHVGKAVMYVYVGKAAMYVHVRKAAMYVHVGKAVVHVHVGKAVMNVYVGKAAMYVHVGKGMMHMHIGKAVVHVHVGKAVMYVYVGKGMTHMHIGKAVVHVHVGKALLYMHVGQAVVHVHVGQAVMYVYVGKAVIHVHVGKAVIYVHIGKEMMYVHVGKAVMNVYVGKAVIYVHVGKAAMYVQVGEKASVPAGSQGSPITNRLGSSLPYGTTKPLSSLSKRISASGGSGGSALHRQLSGNSADQGSPVGRGSSSLAATTGSASSPSGKSALYSATATASNRMAATGAGRRGESVNSRPAATRTISGNGGNGSMASTAAATTGSMRTRVGPPTPTEQEHQVHDITITYGHHSIQGLRDYQEDTVAVLKTGTTFLAGVYDGHGGDQVSKELQRVLLQASLAVSMTATWKTDYNIQGGAEGAAVVSMTATSKTDYDVQGGAEGTTVGVNIADANGAGPPVKAIHNAMSAAYVRTNADMDRLASASEAGSCSISCLITKSAGQMTLFVANAGDCRAVLYTGYPGARRAIRLSQDHKPVAHVAPSEIQRVTAAGGCVLWGRVQGCLAVSRAFGDKTLQPYVIADPYVKARQLNPELDAFIYLVSDGVTDIIEDAAGCAIVNEQLSRGSNVTQAAAALVNAAYHQGSADNITAMVIRLSRRSAVKLSGTSVMLVPLRPSMEERKEANELRELNNSQDHGEFKEHNKKSDSRVALGTQPLFHPFAIKKIIVIGAGVAGLQAARHLLRAGFQVMVLESGPDVGDLKPDTRHPTGKQPEDLKPDTRHPTGKQVHAYVKAYARHFDLYKVLHFNCKLLHLKELEGSMQRRWTAVYHNTVQDKQYKDKQFKVNADYAVISTGICSEPFIPDIPRSELFQGVKIHSMDFADVSIAKGRHVIIVGAGKTAADCVGEVAVTKLAASVTMLYRQVHWPVPRVLGSRSIHSILCTRAISLTLPPYYSKSSVTQKLAAPTRPFKRLFWAAAERLITEQFSLEDSLKPVLSLPADLFYNGQILNNTIDKMISEKEVTTIRGEINCFVPNGVFLKDGTFLNADLVLFCTGYKKTYDFLPGSVRSRLEVQTDGIYLTQEAAVGYLQGVPAPAGAPGRNTAPPSKPAIRRLGRIDASTNTSTTAFSSLPFGGKTQQQATKQYWVNQSIQRQRAVSSKSPKAILEGVLNTSQAVPQELINPDHTFQMSLSVAQVGSRPTQQGPQANTTGPPGQHCRAPRPTLQGPQANTTEPPGQHYRAPDQAYKENFDGGSRSNPGCAGCGALIVNKVTGHTVCEMSHPLPYGCTNNDAEYTGLILGLQVAVRLGIQKLNAVGDSKLVVEQVNCNFAVRKESLLPLFNEVKKLQSYIPCCKVSHVLRASNKKADALSNEAMDIAEAIQRAI
eukprot:gene28039-31140_t